VKYSSSKGATVMVTIVFFAIMTILGFLGKAYPFFCLMIITLTYLIWMWYDTSYLIDGDKLFYRSAFLKGVIEIESIDEIIKNRKLFSGRSPSLSTKGIIIKYNKYEGIYISPKNIDEFIGALKTVNPDFKITE
jgi:Bacterial PH domain